VGLINRQTSPAFLAEQVRRRMLHTSTDTTPVRAPAPCPPLRPTPTNQQANQPGVPGRAGEGATHVPNTAYARARCTIHNPFPPHLPSTARRAEHSWQSLFPSDTAGRQIHIPSHAPAGSSKCLLLQTRPPLSLPLPPPHLTCSLLPTPPYPPPLLPQAAADATYLCDRTHGDAPEVLIEGATGCTFTYIPSHLYYCLFELLKNSARAVCESHKAGDSLPPIKVCMCLCTYYPQVQRRSPQGSTCARSARTAQPGGRHRTARGKAPHSQGEGTAQPGGRYRTARGKAHAPAGIAGRREPKRRGGWGVNTGCR
jgi:hypothetical protein